MAGGSFGADARELFSIGWGGGDRVSICVDSVVLGVMMRGIGYGGSEMVELVLIRGLPGSGKSTLARSMDGFCHYETDMYFVDGRDVYRFDKDALPSAHNWCQQSVKSALACGMNVVVSNTFTRAWEMKPYFDMGYPVRVVTCEGRWQNEHGVPADAIERMASRWEPLEMIDYV